jgi:DNA-binding transcriptional ArsR family regulator
MATKWHRAGPTRAIPVPRNRAASGFLLAGTARMNLASHPRATRTRGRALDIGLLGLADRAALRLLHRILITIPDQLSTLVYSSRRTAYRHLARLARLDLIEVVPLPPRRGGVPFAYRLTGKALRRIGYNESRISGFAHMRHGLDSVEAVCALVRAARTEQAPTSVELWLPESIAGDAGLLPARPDGVVVLQRARLSAVVCLEIDEASEHAPQIRSKLDTWSTVFAVRPELLLLFVVPTESRLTWLRRNAGSGRRPALEGRSFAVVAGDLDSAGFQALVAPVGWRGERAPLDALIAEPRSRRSGTPVGSAAWVELLGSGGGEDVDRVLFDSAGGDEDRKRDAR